MTGSQNLSSDECIVRTKPYVGLLRDGSGLWFISYGKIQTATGEWLRLQWLTFSERCDAIRFAGSFPERPGSCC